MILLTVLTLLGLWIAVGWLLLYWFARPGPGQLQRVVAQRVCARGDQLTITLRAIPPINPATVPPRDVVLLLDRSSSMGAAPGSPFREMLRAAESFVLRLPQQVRVAVVAFDDAAECTSPFTEDKRPAVRAIATIAPGGGTSIGDALKLAAKQLNSARQNVARMVVLFSDGFDASEGVLGAAEALRSHPAKPVIYCASFGDKGSLPLMTEIAGTAERVFHTRDFTGIVNLFDALAAEVTGQRAIGGLLYEDVRAPCPFRLVNAGGSTPVDVHVAESTHVVWPLPQFDNELTPISYVLEPVCIGWHKVISARGSVTWRLPDGSVATSEGTGGTRVLVLPSWAAWAWPFANPCLMLLLAPLLRCRAETTGEPADSVPHALPEVPIPPALPTPTAQLHCAQVQPAIVVGLGGAGKRVVEVLGDYLTDREIDPGLYSLLTVGCGTAVAGRPVAHAAMRNGELVSLDADLWPYLNTYRDRQLPETRSWLPVAKWLSGTTPLSTMRGPPPDRAKVRLTALLNPEPLCAAVATALAAHGSGSVKIVVAGSVEDAETTGLFAELAHLFAVRGKAVTGVLLEAPPGGASESAIAAFGDEMTRFLVRRGEAVVSDRGGTVELAHQMFDRILVVDHHAPEPVEQYRSAAAAVWLLLAHRAVDDRLPPLRADDVYKVQVLSRLAPQHRLWVWVRERALHDAVVQQWLAHDEQRDGGPSAERANEEATRQFVAAFWSGRILNREAPELLARLEAVATGRANGYALIDAGRNYPFNRPYHEQRLFCDRERNAFGYYLEGWSAHIFNVSGEQYRSGMPEALAAATSIHDVLSSVHEKLRPYVQDTDAANLMAFTVSLALEMRALVSRLLDGIEAWHRAFVSRTTTIGTVSRWPSVERSVQARLHESEAALGNWPSLTTQLDPRYRQWLSRQQPNLLANLRLKATYSPDQATMTVELEVFHRSYAAGDDIAQALRSALEPYRGEVLGWPIEAWLVQQRCQLPGGRWLGVGQHADQIFGRSVEKIDTADPAAAVAIAADALPLRDALGYRVPAQADDYIWPEEANAERMRGLIKGLLHRDPPQFSPLAVSLLRRPAAVLHFLRETASGRVAVQDNRVILRRAAGRFVLTSLGGDAVTVRDFEVAAERVVLAEEDLDRQPLPAVDDTAAPGQSADWRDELNRFMQELDASPLGKALAGDAGWAIWRDVASGVFLQHVIR